MAKAQLAEQDAKKRDVLLLRLLKTPPQPRPKRERKTKQTAKKRD